LKAGRYIVVPTTFNPGDTGQFLLRYTLYISWFLEIQDSSCSITYIMVLGDTGQFLLRYTLHISWFLEIQDSSFSGIHYIYHCSWRYRTVSAQVCITFIMVPGYTGQFLLRYALHISWFQDIQDSSCSVIYYIYHCSRIYRTVPAYVNDDVFGLVELYIYIYLGCLVMMYLVWLSCIYIYLGGLVERCIYF